MGCSSSKRGCCGENRPEELGKCASFSPDVRWSWLRGRTLFTFSELRALLKVFFAATASSSQGETTTLAAASTTAGDTTSSSPSAPVSCTHEARAGSSALWPIVGGAGGGAKGQGAAAAATMDKSQFLAVCESAEAIRVSVGAFGARLFDVLDEDGDGLIDFEDFAQGLSKLLKGPESEKLKLMYAAYDLSGVVPSEERSTSSSGRKGSGTGGGFGGGKPKMFRRSKYLTVEDITTVLASASQGAYPTLLQFTAEGGNDNHLSGGGSRSGSPDRSTHGESKKADRPGSRGRPTSGGGEAKRSPSHDARAARDPEALAEVLQELARRNAASYAARAVSEFGQVQDGALTQKEFERWALTAPVLRCRINEFSIDVNVAPFQGVRLA